MTVAASVKAWITLSLIPGLGDESLRKLLVAFSGPEQVLQASESLLKNHVKAAVAKSIGAGIDEQKLIPTLDWLAIPGNHLIALDDPDYPAMLLEISDPPPVFYFKGNRALLNAPSVAIVGSRNATPQGVANAESFAQVLSAAGWCIVSGMALGIDAAAHRGGLKGQGSSIAVVGTGLDKVYPARNRDLAHALAEGGGILSEFPLGTPPLANNFPRRNRIISGLSRGCLVVEAALQSGSLITARQALDQGRDVFAIPGSIHSPVTKGCHHLIKQGAKLVECGQDILEELGWTGGGSHAAIAHESAEQNPLLDCLGHDPIDIDTLCSRAGLNAETVSADLLRLGLQGRVASLPGGLYQILVK